MSSSKTILACFAFAVLLFVLLLSYLPGSFAAIISVGLTLIGFLAIDMGRRGHIHFLGVTAILLLLIGLIWIANEMVADDMATTNLKQLALAMHSYRDHHGTLPPHAIFGKDGKTLLSWRVLILPHIDQEALFNEFRLNEPWNSSHNVKLLSKMPQVYASWRLSSTGNWGMASYRVFVGKGAAFEGTKGLRLPADFPDGAASTMLIVETDEPVPWTKPEDFVFAQDRPLPNLPARFHAAFVDGAIHYFNSPSEATLRAAITRNGGEKLGADW